MEELAARPEMRYVAPTTLAQWAEQKGGLLEGTGASAESARRMIEVRRKLIKALHAGGAGLLLGSDAPQMYNVPGFSIHRELEALVAAGLTPYQALETGTRNVAVFFGTLTTHRDDRAGQAGGPRSARCQPSRGVRNTTRRAGVMLRGRWMPKSEIDAKLAAIAKSVGG